MSSASFSSASPPLLQHQQHQQQAGLMTDNARLHEHRIETDMTSISDTIGATPYTRIFSPNPTANDESKYPANEEEDPLRNHHDPVMINSFTVNVSPSTFIPASAASSTSLISDSTTSPVPPTSPQPFHSYPHIHFRLPADFVETWSKVRGRVMDHAATATTSTPSSSMPIMDRSKKPSFSSSVNGSAQHQRYSNLYHVSFRAMHMSDIAQVAKLHDALFPVKYDQRFYLDLLLSDRVTLLAFLEPNDMHMARDNQTADQQLSYMHMDDSGVVTQRILPEPLLIGIATGKYRETHGNCRRRQSGYVTTLGVDATFRQIGLGRFLLKHLISLLREVEPRIECVFLHVKADNDPAIRMYLQSGFTVYERLPDHYLIDGHKHHALRLVKWIDKKQGIYDQLTQEEIRKSDESNRGWCSIM